MTKLIGITGGIGSGKSYYARRRAAEGYLVYDSDAEAKRVVESNPEVRKAIVELLGPGAFRCGKYQPKYVIAKVFDEQTGAPLLQRLNAIIHPAVLADLQQWKEAHRDAETLYVESAILFESGLNELCDEVVCITAPEDVRIARVMARDGISEAEVRARMARQMPEDERRRRSDRIIQSGVD
ncbi:MAG: dephospho-CoA kinase [Paludibacteraceae bacterium]|nr:dephospho-CoA kinase [Paludibacteraceae bacterium]